MFVESRATDHPREPMQGTAIKNAIAEISEGRMVVVVGEEAAGDAHVVMAAELVTPDAINFMRRQVGGWVGLSLTPERCDDLCLVTMGAEHSSGAATAITVTIDARDGVTTGLSAQDQARTIRVAADPAFGPSDIVTPGHVNPVRTKAGGGPEPERMDCAEAAVDLARLAGRAPAGLICGIQNADGTMARGLEVEAYALAHGLPLVFATDLITYRRRHRQRFERVISARLPTAHGDFDVVGYGTPANSNHHIALVKGDVVGAEDVLVHVRTACLMGHVFRASGCGCAQRLKSAMAEIEAEGVGILVYICNDARDPGSLGPCAETATAVDGSDDEFWSGTIDQLDEARVETHILRDLGPTSLRLTGVGLRLSRSPERAAAH